MNRHARWAVATERNPSDAQSLAEGRVTQAEFEAARRDTPRAFYSQAMDDLSACESALIALEQAVDVRLGLDGPSFSPLRDELESVSDLARRFAKEAGVVNSASSAAATANPVSLTPEKPSAAGTPGMASVPGGPLVSRTQALAQLREVADFFRRTEPHSPVAYLAEKAAKWGEMPLHDWLRAVIKEQGTLSHVEELLGLENGAG